MNLLAFNIDNSRRLRKDIHWRLAVMPIALMFASFIPLVFIAGWLDETLSDGPGWLALFLLTMVILMISGYLLGWILDAAVMRFVFGWPNQQVIRVFLHSEIPTAWLKENTVEQPCKDTGWASVRQMGCRNFVLRRGVLGWGIAMFGAMALGPVFSGRVQPTVLYFAWNACLWGAAGAFFGLANWFVLEKMYAKQRNVAKKPD